MVVVVVLLMMMMMMMMTTTTTMMMMTTIMTTTELKMKRMASPHQCLDELTPFMFTTCSDVPLAECK